MSSQCHDRNCSAHIRVNLVRILPLVTPLFRAALGPSWAGQGMGAEPARRHQGAPPPAASLETLPKIPQFRPQGRLLQTGAFGASSQLSFSPRFRPLGRVLQTLALGASSELSFLCQTPRGAVRCGPARARAGGACREVPRSRHCSLFSAKHSRFLRSRFPARLQEPGTASTSFPRRSVLPLECSPLSCPLCCRAQPCPARLPRVKCQAHSISHAVIFSQHTNSVIQYTSNNGRNKKLLSMRPSHIP